MKTFLSHCWRECLKTKAHKTAATVSLAGM